MREKVFEFLKGRSGYVSHGEIAAHVLAIRPANERLTVQLIESLLAGDDRFENDGKGNWRIKPASKPPDSDDRSSVCSFSVLCMETVRVGARTESIAAIVAARLCGDQIIDRFSACIRPPEARVIDLGSASELLGEDVPLILPRSELLDRLLRFCHGTTIVTFDAARELALLERELKRAGFEDPRWQGLSLKDLTLRLFPDRSLTTLDDLAQAFGLPYADIRNLKARLLLLVEITCEALLLARELGYESISDLVALQNASVSRVDLLSSALAPSLLASLPEAPGVYLMRDRRHRIIYIGKAKNLRSRISSYFYARSESPEKLAALHASLHSIDYQITGSELEACLLEAKLIRSFQPPLNTQIQVHARTTPHTLGRRLIAVLPAASNDRVTLFLLGGRSGLKTFTARRDLNDLAKARKRIKADFFSPGQAAKKPASSWQLELASWWIERNRDRINLIDVDMAGNLKDCMRLLRDYMREAGPMKVIHW